jgi:hypothetical protein
MISVSSKDAELSIVEAKDPGEPLFFDHVVASLSTRRCVTLGDVRLERFVLGSYSLSYANGLAFSNGHPQFPSATSADDPGVHGTGIRPYTSTSAYRYFNGIATTLGLGRFSLDLFASDRRVDATLVDDTITYVSQTGYHRTTTELGRRSDARQLSAGGGLRYRVRDTEGGALEIGVLGYSMHFDHTVLLSDTSEFKLGGSSLSMLSAFAKANTTWFSLTAEYAASYSSAFTAAAVAVTTSVKLTNDLRLSTNIHLLPPRFYSPFGGTFGLHSDDAQNERGYYLGAVWDATKQIRLVAYSITAFNSLLPYSNAPQSRSIETRIGATYRPTMSTSFDGQVRYLNAPSGAHSLLEYRLGVQQHLSHTMEFRLLGRYRLLSDSVGSRSGYALGFEMRYQRYPHLPISLLIEPFSTDDFSARVFSVEPDLPGAMPFVLLYEQGVRYKFVVGYDALRWIRAALAVGHTVVAYPADATMQHKTTVGAQLSMRL